MHDGRTRLNLLALLVDLLQRIGGVSQALIELLDAGGGALAVATTVLGNAPGLLGAA